MSMRREEEHSWLARVFKCSDGRENAIGREEDIVKIKKMILRDTPDPIFVVGAKYVGKTQLARHLYKHWKEEEKAIVPVLFSFIGDFASFDDRSLLEQFSVKVILDCQTKDCGTASAQKGNAPSLIEQAVDAAKVMRKQKRRVVILIDDWLAILDRCRELDKRAFADFLNIGLTKLKDAGATFVFLDRFPCRVLPEEILEKLPAVRDPYYLLPLAYNAVVAVAKKKKYKIDQAGEALWNYVGGNIDLVKRLCDHWKGANAICDNEREKIHNVMDELVRSLARLFVKTKEEAVKLLQRLAENPETVVNDPVVKELCRMGVVDSSGGGPWMCGAMREYLFSCNGEGTRENKKLKVVLKCQKMTVEIVGKGPVPFPEDKKGAIGFALLYLLLTDKERYGHMTYSEYRRNVLGRAKEEYALFMDIIKSKANAHDGWTKKIPKVYACLGGNEIVTREDVKEVSDILRERDFEPKLEKKECHVIPIGCSWNHPIATDSNWSDFLDVVVEE